MMDLRSSKNRAGQPHLAPSPPHMQETAFLLDFDGTLVDIAPKPELVRVEDGLIDLLHKVRHLNGDALAIISGRSIAEIDHFLPNVPFAVSGEHGFALRSSPDAAIKYASPDILPEAWVASARALSAELPGTMIECKQNGLVFHYRNAPDTGPKLKAFAERLLCDNADYILQPAKMAWEIRLSGHDKGKAVASIMALPNFRGKRPVFVGDDVTDRDGVREAIAMGGCGYLIPDDFPSAGDFRHWLRHCVEVAQ